MARPFKKGLSFFSLQVDALSNKKVRLLQADTGERGVLVWLHILSYAYKETGYYFDLNQAEEVDYFATEVCKCSIADFNRIVDRSVKRKLFMEEVYKKHRILTCEDMQDTYLHATADRRKKGTAVTLTREYINEKIYDNRYEYSGKIFIIHGKNEVVPWKNEVNPVNNPHSIVKNSIEEYSKAENSIEEYSVLTDTPTDFLQNSKEGKKQKPDAYSDVLKFFDKTLSPLGVDGGYISQVSQKFYNYYDSKRWEVEGKPLADWEARARLWMSDDLKKLKK